MYLFMFLNVFVHLFIFYVFNLIFFKRLLITGWKMRCSSNNNKKKKFSINKYWTKYSTNKNCLNKNVYWKYNITLAHTIKF